MRVAAVSLFASAALCLAGQDTPSNPPASKADAFAAALRGNRGFANADLESDESMKMIRNEGLHHVHGGHKTVRPRDSAALDSDMRAIQSEVESMVHRVKLLSDEDAFEFVKELDGIEGDLQKGNSDDRGLVQEISAVRADLCTRKGFTGAEATECEAFMHKACVIDSMEMDAAPIVPEEECLKFYSLGGQTNATAAAVSAPAPAPAAAPGPAPALDGWSMKYRPLPDQGFSGPLKEHKDMDTSTKDWRREFGPKSGSQSYKEICAQYPKNEWCRLHGFFRTERVAQEIKSGAARPFSLGAFAVAAAMLSW